MKTKTQTQKPKNKLNRRGLINRVQIDFDVSESTFVALKNFCEREEVSLDDVVKIGLEAFVAGFNKPKSKNS